MAHVIAKAAFYCSDSRFSQKRFISRFVIDDISIINYGLLEALYTVSNDFRANDA